MDISNVPDDFNSPLIPYSIFSNESSLANPLENLPNNSFIHSFSDSLPIITSTQYLNQEILPITQIALQNFSNSPDFSNNIELAFGYGCNVELAHKIVDNLANGQGIPDIQIIPQSQLKADGAFGNNTIYISQNLLNPQQSDSSQVVNVLLEEMGHYIDSQINIQDAPGDEGAIFAHLVQNKVLQPGELTALKAEDDHGILNINGQNIAVEHADTPGVFLVDNTEKISINFLADSGSYRSEMAVFSLQGLDNLTPGSVDYIKEAARRALSNSTLGHVVIVDPNEGAKFSGELGESNKNEGNYSGLKTFSFTAGDKVAFMLVPQGTVQQIFDNPNIGNNQRPLFSIAAANPNNATQIGQLIAGTYGWEDIRVDQGTDADYNDIIFQIKGATGVLTDIGGLFASGKDWRNVPLAQEIIAFASQDNNINLTAKLSQDTGISNLDGITNNSEISGFVNNAGNISKFQAQFSDGSNFVDILSELKTNGNFVLNKEKLAQIKGSQLADDDYQLNLRAEDKFGNVSEYLVKFTLDTTKPATPTNIGLKNDSDTVTNQKTPTITGKGENGALIEIFDGQNKLGQTTVANGFWEVTTTQITDGFKNLTVTATDVAGNKSDASTKEVTIDSVAPLLNITNPPANAVLNPGARLQGTVNGTGSQIDKLSYRFDNNSEINVPVNAQGTFDVELNLTGVSGQQNLIIKAIDLAGNSTETTQSVVVGQAVGFMLDTLFDSAPIGDSRTTYDTVNLLGQTDANATVTLQQTGASTTADAAGKFKFTGVSLTLGDNSFTVNATNTAGNTGQFTTIIKRVDQDNSDVVLDWNATLLNAIYTDKTAPPIASRNMAIAQTAVFDAINSITGTYKNYHFTGTAPTIVSAEAAAASAAYTVLLNLYPKQKTFFDTILTASLAKITDGEAENTGVTFGQIVANDILTLRSTDGANTTVTYTPGTNPGDWQPTPPANASALLPQWGQIIPFALTSGSQFRPAGEPALTSDQYTADFNQVKDLGSINSTTRTAEQTEIAKFWSDGSGTFTPPGHWNQIAQNVAVEKGNSLVDNARLFALLDISLADAGIAAWDAKYTYNSWRPITAIQNADSDGNSNTIADANWTPLLTTPPFPSYISGHSTFSGAAATVLTTLLGDNVSFSLNSLGTPGVERTFSNFTNAANEAGISRIYGGIHFNTDNVDGLATGKSVGNYVLQNLLAPITEPVQKLSVMPGEQLKLESQDIFGKNANFAIESKESLPKGMLDSDGTLIFKPTPAQIGTYDFTLVARDGEQVTTKKFNLAVVADTLTTTRISGVIQNTDQKALAGVVVKIGNVSATTAADGSFTLTLAGVPSADAALIIQPGQQVDNVVYPSIAEKLPLLLGHDVYASVKNIIDRPIFLPPIDISNAQTINPAITQTVTSAAIPGSSVKVAANTLFDQENKPYTGKLSITTVPTELTPAALPDNLRPDLVVTIQPGEMKFTTPAPLSLPNLAGYAPGTQMDLWSINPQTGFFDKVGVGQVSADGKVINTISGGIRNSSWHFFAPPAPTPDDPDTNDYNPEEGCDLCQATASSNSDVELYSGAEIETHNLVSYQSLGVSRGLTLRYDSERADARPIVHFGYSNVPSDPNLRLMAELTVKRGDFTLQVPGFGGGKYGLNGGENFWSIPNGGGKIDAALQADLRALPSGRYDYDLTTGLLRLNNDQFNGSTSSSSGKLLVVNTVNSAFGSGWGLAGLQELVTNPDGSVMLIDGDGGELLFEKNVDNTYKSPVGHFSTLERLGDGTFRHTTKDQTVYSFDAQNRLISEKDRIGNETRYTYQNGLLNKIIDPVGLETTFTYTGNKITQITDPAGRVTKLSYDSNGNLLKITDPDGSNETWEYDASHHMTAGIDQLGNRGQTFYNFAGRVTNSILKDGSAVKFDPVEVQGLYEPNKTNDPLNAPVAFQLGAATSTYTDANGKKIVNKLDRAGQILSSSDEVGLLPSVKRNQDYLVTQQTDAIGNISLFSYDTKGNVIKVEDTVSGSKIFSGSLSGVGDQDEFIFDAMAGQKILFDDLSENPFLLSIELVDPNSSSLFISKDQPITLTQNGTYKLTITGNGEYNFRLLELSNLPTLNLATTVIDSLFPSNEAKLYRFNGTAGERLRFDNLSVSAAFAAGWTLYGQNNQVINTNNFNSDFVATLPVTGEYLLVINGNSSNNGNPIDYSFQVVSPEITTTALTLGNTISGSISQLGNQAIFTFDGTVGQKLYYDALNSFSSLSLSLKDPNGNQLFNFFGNTSQDQQPITLTQAGTYQVIINSQSGIGDYNFRLLDVSTAVETLDLNKVINSSLAPSQQAKLYRFNGTAGERLRFDNLSVSTAFAAGWTLYGPNNQLIPSNQFSNTNNLNSDFVATLPVTGEYLLVINGNSSNNGNPIDYSFQVVSPEITTTALTLGNTISGSISQLGNQAIFTFDGTVGQKLYYDALNSFSSLSLSLKDPNGNQLFNFFGNTSQDQQPITLTQAGTYQVIINSQSGIGDYNFRLLDVSTAVETLDLNKVINSSLAPSQQAKLYRFNGTAGERLRFDNLSVSTAFAAGWTLYGPNNQLIPSNQFSNTNNLNSDFVATLPVTGEYLLVINGNSSNNGNPIDYSFQVVSPEITTTALTLGNTISGSISQLGNQAIFTFDGTVGQKLYYDALNSFSSLSLSLKDPNGNQLFNFFGNTSQDQQPITLTQAGTYQVIINSQSGIGDYNFRLLDVSTAVETLDLNKVINSSLAPSQQAKLYRFNGTAGERLRFDNLSVSTAFAAGWTLYGPNNQLIPSNQFSNTNNLNSDFVATLPVTGEYLLVINGNSSNNGNPIDYSFQVVSPEITTTALTLGNTISGSISQLGNQAIFTFDGTVGQKLYYDALNSFSSLSLSLKDPNGNQLFNFFGNTSQDQQPITLTQAGTYQVIINSQSGIGDYNFRLLDVSTAVETLDLNKVINSSLAPSQQAKLYRFNGTAGERLRFDNLSVSTAFAAGWTLYGQNNQVINTNNFNSDFVATLPVTGEYLLVINGNSSNNGNPIDYSFQVVSDQVVSDELKPTALILGSSSNDGSKFTYDPKFNQLTSKTDELGHQTLYQIDPNNGNLLSLTQVVGAVGGDDDLVTKFTYTDKGLVDLITDPLGRITDEDYDAQGRLTSIIYAKGTTDEAKRQFEYDLAGNQTAIINENGDRTVFEYDALNRLVKTVEADPDGAGPLTSPVTSYSYDAKGNLIKTTDAVGHVAQNTYDPLNRLIQSIDALNQKTTYGYDKLGNLLSVVDPLENKTENQYDARNRVIETIAPDGGITKFTYDLSNNLVSVTDPVNNQTAFAYDARNRLISETDPLGKTKQYQYDAVNNLIATTDRNNRKIEYKYDDINRRTTETWVGSDEVINYSYDKASNQTAVNDKFSSLAFTYDNRDSLLSVNNAGTPGFANVLLNYGYDKVGNVLSVADKINNVAGGNNSYGYDALNRLTKLTQSGNGVNDKRVDFGYNVLGQYTSVNRYANLTATQLVNGTTYSYDSLNRLTNLNHSTGSNNVAFYNYVYDAASRITKITDIDGATDYTYDNHDQLTSANHSNANNPDETYTYDANGNRITSSIHGNGYVTGKGNRLLSDGKYNYEYDNEGNLTKQTEITTGKVQELTWDYRNRLVAFVNKDAAGKETQRVEFTYDVFNRRIAKAVDTNPQDTTPAVVTQFIYDGQDVLLEFVDSDGAGANQPVLDKRYLHGAGVDQVLAQESAGNVVWHLTDHLGTVRDLVNNSGAVVNHLVYDSYGQVISESNAAVDTRYLFTGREFDSETGLYYYRARYYDATNGRFISLDPIGIGSGSVNLYSYVGGNPISFVDMFGNKKCSGNARVLQGNKGLIGKEGAFSGNKKYPVTDDSAAILLEQFGKSKADLRPDIDNISGKIGDPKAPLCTFNKVRDRIDDNNAREKLKKTPYEMWKERSPGNFIVELPGIDKDLGVQPIELSVPDSYNCPEGTKEVK